MNDEHKMDRRNFARAIGAGLAAGLAGAAASAPAAAAGSRPAAPTPGAAEKPFNIGMIAFDGMTYLDMAGPLDSFARIRAAKVLVLGKTMAPIVTDTGHKILAEMTLKDAPDLDMLFVGGGGGVLALMEDPEVLAFLRDRAPKAKYVTSVCTGALVLGAAGLLRGYKAATHWTAMDTLPTLGAIPVNERVVIDRNRITGGGVTAGIDFGLVVVSHLWGEETAQLIQLGSEYNPKPPFNAGDPRTAPPAVVTRYKTISAKQTDARLEAAKRRAARNFV